MTNYTNGLINNTFSDMVELGTIISTRNVNQL